MRYTLEEYERASAIMRDPRNATRPPSSFERKQLHSLQMAYVMQIDHDKPHAEAARQLLAHLDPAAAAHHPL